MRKSRLMLVTLILITVLAACGSAEDSGGDSPTDANDDTTITNQQEPITEQRTADEADDVDMDASESEIAGDIAPQVSSAPTQMAMAQMPPPSPPPSGGGEIGGGAGGGAGGGPGNAPVVSSDAVQQQIPPTPDAMTFDNPGTNPFFDTADDHLSTFAMDVDTGSYTLTRSYLTNSQQLPPEDAIRPEEFVNYFDAGYDSPEEGAFAIHLDAAPAPFGYDGHYLMRVGLQGRYIAAEDRDAVFLIFVIDVSGSMDREDRLGTVKESLALLTAELREDDRVALVVYSSQSRVVLEPTPASDRDTIMSAINALQPEGSTNVEDGLRLGYGLAQENQRDGENTRVIVLSDGVANVGNTGPDAILNTIRDGVEENITLSTIGFGMGNYNDVLMEQLANDGNGNYYYVDNLREARRVFVHNLTGTLQVIGYDARVQVDFNPEVTDRYRLIGYENRAIADEDFRNDTVDAGEVGAGHSVTALYELALEDDVMENPDLVVATVYIRYEDADSREVVEISRELTIADLRESFEDAPASFQLQAAVAEFAEQLRGSVWAEDGNLGEVMAIIDPLHEQMPDDETLTDFVDMVAMAIQYQDR